MNSCLLSYNRKKRAIMFSQIYRDWNVMMNRTCSFSERFLFEKGIVELVEKGELNSQFVGYLIHHI